MIRKSIINIVAEQINCDSSELSGSMSLFDDLNVDPDEFLSIISYVEDEFEVEITDEELEEIDTINDVVNYLERVL